MEVLALPRAYISPVIESLVDKACKNRTNVHFIIDFPNLVGTLPPHLRILAPAVGAKIIKTLIDAILFKFECTRVTVVHDTRLGLAVNKIFKLTKESYESIGALEAGRLTFIDIAWSAGHTRMHTDEAIIDLFREALRSNELPLLVTRDSKLVDLLERMGYAASASWAIISTSEDALHLNSSREMMLIVNDCKREPPRYWPPALRHAIEKACGSRVPYRVTFLLYSYSIKGSITEMHVEIKETCIHENSMLEKLLKDLGLAQWQLYPAIAVPTTSLKPHTRQIPAKLSAYLQPVIIDEPRKLQRLRINRRVLSRAITLPTVKYHLAVPLIVSYEENDGNYVAGATFYDMSLGIHVNLGVWLRDTTRWAAESKMEERLRETLDWLRLYASVEEASEASGGHNICVVRPPADVKTRVVDRFLKDGVEVFKPVHVVPQGVSGLNIRLYGDRLYLLPYAYTPMKMQSKNLGSLLVTLLTPMWMIEPKVFTHPKSGIRMVKCRICGRYAPERDMVRKVCPDCLLHG